MPDGLLFPRLVFYAASFLEWKNMASPRQCRRLLAILCRQPARRRPRWCWRVAGDMSTTEAVLWVRADNSGGATVAMSRPMRISPISSRRSMVATSRDSDFTLAAGRYTHPHTRYFYRFRASDGSPARSVSFHGAGSKPASGSELASAMPTAVSAPTLRLPISRRRSSIFSFFSVTRCTKPRAPARPPFL